ncbi:MAG: histidinol-phosphatase HisJ family protein [Clostridia bacterium]|nr:histidinol-phosphatase HisJ family protein [Clostridia bacterium]MBR2496041.1 histidinol-phosphatase HisJ family protein [Clostridia bacterium]
MIKSNFHTHTTYCDGKNSPFEIAEFAHNLGVKTLGFSVHSFIDEENAYWTLSPKNTENYKADVLRIKEEYQGKMDVLLGIEQDVFSNFIPNEYEYAIGSVHAIKKCGKLFPVDYSAETTQVIIKELYNGKFDDYAKDYFKLVEQIPNVMDADIIGHIDVITKFVNGLNITLTDTYYEYAFKAIERLAKLKIPFEINTGVIIRGYKDTPYPDLTLLKKIKSEGGDIIYSSDCHQKEQILFGFEDALNLAKSVGFNRICRLTKEGYEYDSLD